MGLSHLIKKIPLFSSLDFQIIENLCRRMHLKTLRQGQILFSKGDEGTALYIVKRGGFKIVLRSKMGGEIIVAMFSKNDFFGAMSMLDREPRSADAIAFETSEVFVLQQADFLSVLQSDSEALKSILCELSRRLRTTDDILEDVCFLKIPARLAKKLVGLALSSRHPHTNAAIVIEHPFTQQELGDMIGASRESINKELRILSDKGLIDSEGGNIKILDIERLKRRIH